MLKWCSALLDRICVVAGAITFAQIPLFIQQYSQQLTGREAELRIQVNAMQQAAQLSNKTLEQYIQKFMMSADSDFAQQGHLMHQMVERWKHLSESLTALQSSTIFEKPFVFFKYLHFDTFAGTFQKYHFGLPLNLEGAIYATIGIGFGYVLFQGLKVLFASFLKKSPKASY